MVTVPWGLMFHTQVHALTHIGALFVEFGRGNSSHGDVSLCHRGRESAQSSCSGIFNFKLTHCLHKDVFYCLAQSPLPSSSKHKDAQTNAATPTHTHTHTHTHTRSEQLPQRVFSSNIMYVVKEADLWCIRQLNRHMAFTRPLPFYWSPSARLHSVTAARASSPQVVSRHKSAIQRIVLHAQTVQTIVLLMPCPSYSLSCWPLLRSQRHLNLLPAHTHQHIISKRAHTVVFGIH
jgi:hypothetical protein